MGSLSFARRRWPSPNVLARFYATAFEELQRQALAIEDPHLRSSFFERVPLNHAIVAAYEQITSSSAAWYWFPLPAAMPHWDGRSKRMKGLQCSGRSRAPEDEAVSDKAQLRRQRLKRLLEQAESQGAAPTDDDLANALGVSRRTILRDLQAMAQEIETPPTRKRKR